MNYSVLQQDSKIAYHSAIATYKLSDDVTPLRYAIFDVSVFVADVSIKNVGIIRGRKSNERNTIVQCHASAPMHAMLESITLSDSQSSD